MKIGVIGYGYWGPNIVRNFNALPGVEVTMVCDASAERLAVVQGLYPAIHTTGDAAEIFASAQVDAVAVVTPVSTHFELARRALESGKHLFIEKPFTSTVAEGERLIELADQKNLIIMVDHTFLFTGAVLKIKELIDSGELGDLWYFDSTRVNLGLFQHDVNVIWDLAPHDFSILDFITDNRVLGVSAVGIDHFDRQVENIAYVHLFLENKMVAHFNLNWTAPVKVRTTLVGGSKKMLLWDDLEPSAKIKIYDSGVTIDKQEDIHKLRVSYRVGDMWAPKVEQTEALKLEAQYFVDCVSQGKTPHNDGAAGLRVVRMLEACMASMRQGGRQVDL